MNLPNLDYFRSLKIDGAPDFGARMYEFAKAIVSQSRTTEQQTNVNAQGQPQPPPQVNGLNVQGQNGHFSVAITDNNPIYRGIQYYVEHDTSPNFSNPTTVHIGDSRNANLFLGSGTRYWRAYSAYASSAPSAPVYHGSSVNPTAVDAGGSIGGPASIPSQGSGTGAVGVGLSGPGPVPFRSNTGAPPSRG